MARESDNSAMSMALGFTVGVIAGLAAGILLAPKSGKETRDQIAQKAQETYGKAQEVTKNTVNEAKDKATTVANKTKAAVREGTRAAKEA